MTAIRTLYRNIANAITSHFARRSARIEARKAAEHHRKMEQAQRREWAEVNKIKFPPAHFDTPLLEQLQRDEKMGHLYRKAAETWRKMNEEPKPPTT